MSSQLLSDQVALVTGGSKGIGRAICIKLASLGATVIVNYSSTPEGAEETVKLCKEKGVNAEAIKFNVASSSEVDAAFETVLSKFGKIDILVNNAGISKDGLLMRMKDEDWSSVINTNLSGSFYCARSVSKSMLKAKRGTIINISSVVGEMGNPGQAPYVSSKAGLIGLTKSMAKELASRGITVNCVAPGFIQTEMTDALPVATREEHYKSIPLGRYGTTEDVAEVVAFLAGSGAKYITGQIIGINGGMYM